MIKTIIKRIIIGVGVALALMFIKGNLLMVVNAKSILTHKAPFESYTYNNTVATFTTTIDSPFFANANVGNLYFTFAVNKSSGNSTFPISIIRTVVAFSGSTGYVCNIGSSSLSNSTYGGVTYSAQCPMNIGSSGITKIVYYPSDLQSNDLSIYRFTNEGYYSFETDSTVNVTVDTSTTTTAINNQTTTITNNQNQNTQDIIDNQKDLLGNSCKNLFNKTDYTTITTGNNGGATTQKTSDNIIIITSSGSTSSGAYISRSNITSYITGYDNSKTYTVSMDVKANRSLSFLTGGDNRTTFNIGTTVKRISIATTFTTNGIVFYSTENNANDEIQISKIQIEEGSNSSAYCVYGSTLSKLDDTNQGINNINNTLNNSDTEQVQQDSDSAFLNFNIQTHGLTRIVTAPIRLLASMLGGTCSSLSIPLPFVNQNVVLPCMSSIYEEHFGNFLVLYRLITDGIIGYMVGINVFRKCKDFLDPNNDKIEVFNL